MDLICLSWLQKYRISIRKGSYYKSKRQNLDSKPDQCVKNTGAYRTNTFMACSCERTIYTPAGNVRSAGIRIPMAL